MDKTYINSIIKSYLAEQFSCELSGLESSNTIFTVNNSSESPYIKIMAFDKCIVVSASKSIQAEVKSALAGRNRDEIFEFPFVYGQTIHYVPDVKSIKEVTLSDDYSYELLQGSEVNKLKGLSGFDNSLAFDCQGNITTKMAFIAKKGNEIIGVAGANAETDKLWEVGVDVKSEYRKGGLGSKIVSKLTKEIIKQGIVPFYSASVTNIGSQMVANRSGYIPCWVDTYSNILNGSSVYDSYVKNLRL